MAGVSVQESGVIYLGDTYFRIVGPARVGNITATPNPVLFGDTANRTASQLMTQLSQSSYVGGIGVREGNVRTHTERSYDSQLETRYRNWLTLPPYLYSGTGAAGANGQTSPVEFNGNVYAFFGVNVYPITAISTAGITFGALDRALPGAAQDALVFQDKLFVAEGATGYSYRSTAGAWTDSGAALPTHLAVWDARLWSLEYGTTSHTIKFSLDGVTWTAAASLPGSPTCPLPHFRVWVDSQGNSALYIIHGKGALGYDSGNDRWLVVPYTIPTGTFFSASSTVSPQDSKLYLASNTSMAITQVQAGNPLSFASVGFDRDDGRPASWITSVVTGLTSDVNGVYAMTSTSTANIYQLWCYLWGGWHFLAQLGNSEVWTSNLGPSIVPIGSKLYLLVATSNRKIQGVELPTAIINPRLAATRDYAAGPYRLYTPWWDYGEPLQYKSHGHIFVEVENASATETVKVYYGIDRVESYTLLQTITAPGLYDISVGGAAGLRSRFFQYAFEMTRGSTTTAAPRMRLYTAEVMPLLPASFAYNFEINVSKPFKGKSAKAQLDALKRLSDPSQTPNRIQMAYTDKETGALQTYWGRILRVNGIETPELEFKGTGQYTISFGVPYPQDTE